MTTKNKMLDLFKLETWVNGYRRADKQERETFTQDKDAFKDLANDFIDDFGFVVVGVIGSAILSIFAVSLLGYPGGLAGWIGNFYAGLCRVDGWCDLDKLNAAFGMATIISINLCMTFLFMIFRNRDDNDVTLEDVSNDVAEVAEMIETRDLDSKIAALTEAVHSAAEKVE